MRRVHYKLAAFGYGIGERTIVAMSQKSLDERNAAKSAGKHRLRSVTRGSSRVQAH